MLIKMKNKMLSSIYNVIIVFLIFTLLISFGLFLKEMVYYAHMNEPNEVIMLSNIKYKNYYRFYENSIYIDPEKDKDNENLIEFYYVGQYYKNASLYKAYKTEGVDTSKYENLMQESRDNVVTFSFALDEISEKLDID